MQPDAGGASGQRILGSRHEEGKVFGSVRAATSALDRFEHNDLYSGE